MSETGEIWYLRTGRVRRGRGYVIEAHATTKAVKVNPRGNGNRVWITASEIEAGRTPRKKNAEP